MTIRFDGTVPPPDDRHPHGPEGGPRRPEPHMMNVPVGKPRHQLSAEEIQNMQLSESRSAELGNLNNYWEDDGLSSRDILEGTKAGKDLLKEKSLRDITGEAAGVAVTDENGKFTQKYKNGTLTAYVDENGQDVCEFTYDKDGSKLKITNKGQQTYYAKTGNYGRAESNGSSITYDHANFSETKVVPNGTLMKVDYEILKRFENVETLQYQVYDSNGNLGVTTYETGKGLKQSIKNGF